MSSSVQWHYICQGWTESTSLTDKLEMAECANACINHQGHRAPGVEGTLKQDCLAQLALIFHLLSSSEPAYWTPVT
eukprot:1140850-Pelagomonas_calceolata.AAC.7